MKKLTKQQKLEIFDEFLNLLSDATDSILKTKELMPWSGTNVSPTYAVTTSACGYQLDRLRNNFMGFLRNN